MNPFDDKLAQFIDDEAMYQAVRSILEAQFDLNIQIDNHMPDIHIRYLTRAVLDGRKLLDKGFKELNRYKRSKVESKETINIAI